RRARGVRRLRRRRVFFLPGRKGEGMVGVLWTCPQQKIEVVAGRRPRWVAASRWEPLPRLYQLPGPRTHVRGPVSFLASSPRVATRGLAAPPLGLSPHFLLPFPTLPRPCAPQGVG